jgi:hypothetical protein
VRCVVDEAAVDQGFVLQSPRGLRARGEGFPAACSGHNQSDGKDHEGDQEGDSCRILKAALETGVANVDSERNGNRTGEYRYPSQPGRGSTGREDRSAKKDEGQSEQQTEVALAPLAHSGGAQCSPNSRTDRQIWAGAL